ncbi:adenosylcobinamide-phosphate synthase CbiB [Sulfitobacter sp. LCG007]
MSTAAMLACALLLDAALGEPRWLWDRLPHPAVLMGRAVGACDKAFNRGGARRLKGICVVFLLAGAAWILGRLLETPGPLIAIPVAAILLAQRSLADHVRQVADGLRMSLAEGRRSVARIVSRDTGGMDGTGVARAAIESAAENFSDGVVAPAFWFLIGGLPGILIYKLVNTADSMIGYRTARHESFGWAAARLDDVLNLIPARLTALLILLIGRVTDRRGIVADARRHKSPNAGWPEAAAARALGVALAGPRSYGGVSTEFPFVNAAGRRMLGPEAIDAAVRLLWRGWAALVCLVLLVAFIA